MIELYSIDQLFSKYFNDKNLKNNFLILKVKKFTRKINRLLITANKF